MVPIVLFPRLERECSFQDLQIEGTLHRVFEAAHRRSNRSVRHLNGARLGRKLKRTHSIAGIAGSSGALRASRDSSAHDWQKSRKRLILLLIKQKLGRHLKGETCPMEDNNDFKMGRSSFCINIQMEFNWVVLPFVRNRKPC